MQSNYHPAQLLDQVAYRLQLKNDAALARALEVAPPIISKVRNHRMPVGASLLIRMHEVTGLSIRELQDLMGDRRQKYRLSPVQGRPVCAVAHAAIWSVVPGGDSIADALPG